MRRLVFALLCGLVLVPLPVHAQGSVTFTVCNTGTVDIEVFVSGTATLIRPTTCTTVAQAKGAAQPAFIGIAFTDSRGQWGAARRFDGVPYMGVKDLPAATKLAMRVRGEPVPTPLNVLSLATRTETVRRGNANVSLPMQLLFQPRVPECVGTGTTVPDAGKIYVGRTYCEDLGYTLTVEPYADSHEISLGSLPVSGAVSSDLRISGNSEVNWAREEAARKEREGQPVNWSDLLPALRSVRYPRPTIRDVLPRYIVIRGTVSSVEVDDTTQFATVTFREDPSVPNYTRFKMCTGRLDILRDRFGADFRTSMVGKPIEVRGNFGQCGRDLGMNLLLAHQVSPVPSVQFAAGTRVWTPPPPASPAEKAAVDPKAQELQERRRVCAEQAAAAYPNFHLSSERFSAYTKAQQDCFEKGIVPTAPAAAPAVALPPATAPAPATTSSTAAAAAKTKAAQEQQQRAAQEKPSAQQKSAQEAKQRMQACTQELFKAHPDGGRSDPAGFQKGLLACAQIQQVGPAK